MYLRELLADRWRPGAASGERSHAHEGTFGEEYRGRMVSSAFSPRRTKGALLIVFGKTHSPSDAKCHFLIFYDLFMPFFHNFPNIIFSNWPG